MRSVYDAIKVSPALRPINVTGTGTPGALALAIDTFGFNTALFNVSVGTSFGTAVAVTFTLDAAVYESAASGGTYTAVTDADIVQITSFNKMAQIRVEGLGTSRMRYLKLYVVPAVTPALDAKVYVTAEALLGRAFQEPVDNSDTGA